jgi:hypothetical protein
MRCLAVLTTLAFALLPSFSHAQGIAPQTQARCVVGSEAPDSYVVLAIGTVDNQAAIDRAAAMCSSLIDSGEWFGLPNDKPLHSAEFVGIGSVLLEPVVVMGIWAGHDYPSVSHGYAILEHLSMQGYPVDYY